MCSPCPQLEVLVAEMLGSPRLIPAFMRAAGRQMGALREADAERGVPGARARVAGVTAAGEVWPELHAGRPEGVARSQWEGLFEFVAWKSTLLVGAERALTLLEDLCDAARFECIAPRADAST